MAAQSGRDLLVLKDGTAIAGLRETGVTVNSEPVDITNKGSDGYQTFASFAGVESIEISTSGVWQDDILRGIMFSGTGTSKLLDDITLRFPDGATISGDFYAGPFESGGNHDGEETYSCPFKSSGAWTYTAAT